MNTYGPCLLERTPCSGQESLWVCFHAPDTFVCSHHPDSPAAKVQVTRTGEEGHRRPPYSIAYPSYQEPMLLHAALFRRGLTTKDVQKFPTELLSNETEQRCRRILGKNSLPPKVSAGVLVTLCTSGGAPAFLYTLRSSTLKGRHKGDVSFPGGKCDSSDRDVIDTALREAQEELGVTLSRSTIWGPMKPITDWTGMVIVPVLANIGCLEDLSMKPNREEVESLLTLPLSLACTSSIRGYTCFRQGGRYAYTLPVFRLPGHNVWGLTAMMTDSALSLLFPSSYHSVLSGSRAR